MEVNNIINESVNNNHENINYKNLEKLQKHIEKLDLDHHLQIGKILYKHNIKLTQNDNGIFVNLNNLSQHIIDLLWKYLEFINNQEKYINKDEDKKLELEKIFF
tara:strand:- start:5704 stop:6015 length:312 start_codon:yes stop_codon:yes gene_type:complete